MSAVPSRHHTAQLGLAFGLDALALVALLAYVLVTGGEGRDDDAGFLGDPLPDGLALLALVAVIAGSVVAARALIRHPSETPMRRRLLLIPLLIGVGAVVFFLGDLFVPN